LPTTDSKTREVIFLAVVIIGILPQMSNLLWGFLIVYLIVALMFYLQWLEANDEKEFGKKSDSYVIEAALLWPWHLSKPLLRAIRPPMGSPMDVKAIEAEKRAADAEAAAKAQ
jgi:hypothetical protein